MKLRSVWSSYLLTALLAGGPLQAAAQAGLLSRGVARVITRDEIAQSGAIRLTDVLRLIPGWFDYSVDGYTWGLVPDILNLPRQESWILLVDGQPVDVRVLGHHESNALGLDVGLIDSVEVFATPIVRRGIRAPNGLVHIHTVPPKRYYELQGSLGVGNATGDPGPYFFTPHNSPNIDRIGPTSSASAAAGGKAWYARGAMKHDEHHITDPRIWPRVWLLFQDFFQARQQLLSQRFDSRGFFLNGEAGVAIDNFRLHQFRFVEQLGAEVPVTLVYLRVGSAGEAEVHPSVRVFYSGSYSVTEIDPRANSANLFFDYREDSGFGAVGLLMELPEADLEVGASHELRNLHTDDPLVDRRTTLTGAYATLATSPLDGLHVSGTFDLRKAEKDLLTGLLGRIHYGRPFGPIWFQAALQGAHVRSPAWTGNPLWFWTQRGYGFLDRAGVDHTGVRGARLPVPERQWVEMDVRAMWKDYGSLRLSGAYSHFTQQAIPVYHRRLERRDVGLFMRDALFFPTRLHLEAPVSGDVFRGSAELVVTPIRGLTNRSHYAYTLPVSDQTEFRDLWAAVPDHQLTTSLTYATTSRISLFLRLRYESWSDWPEYLTVASFSGDFWPARLPVTLMLDLAVRKQFWKEHFEASVLLSNLLNRHVQRHPAARVEPLSMYARIQIRI